ARTEAHETLQSQYAALEAERVGWQEAKITEERQLADRLLLHQANAETLENARAALAEERATFE
ncbi:unnamed protein product, partial [Amoebophrya sp. A25]